LQSALSLFLPFAVNARLTRHRLCRVFSDTIPDSVKALVAAGLEVDWEVTIQHEGRVASTLAALRGVGVTHLLVGSEPGVSLHAELSAAFAGGAALSLPREALELRRNKYLQSEAIRSAGCDAVHQRLAHTHDDVEAFIHTIEASAAKRFKARPAARLLGTFSKGSRTPLGPLSDPSFARRSSSRWRGPARTG